MNLSTGIKRAIVIFILVAIFLSVILNFLGNIGINFFAEPILVMIGAGWAAYYTWKKTEHGRY